MIAAVMMVRDEQDVIGYTLDHLRAEGVDHAIVADNLSVDGTRSILESFGDFVTIVDDPEVGYYQDTKTTRLADQALHMGAEWVLPCDADELFYSTAGTLAEFFAVHPADVVTANVWDHIATDDDDPHERNPFARITWRRQYPQRLHKVAFRAHPDVFVHMGNHGVDHPGERGSGLYGRHFQYRTYEQMVRKLTNGREAYEASNLQPMHGTHWREGGARTPAEHDAEWRRLCEEPGLIEDPAPYRGAR
jgi:glycosyltransferase involved in cell wall biosynthesis